MSYVQRAHGQFTVPVIPGTPHCGIDHNAVTCAYRVELEFDDSALDHNGFLLDNTAFAQYFMSLGQTPVSVSCENLCKRICSDLCKLCNDRARYARVALSPFQGVEIEYAYAPTTALESTPAIAREFSQVVAA